MTNVFSTYQLSKSRLDHCPAIPLPFIGFEDVLLISGCAAALQKLRCRGIDMAMCVRHTALSDNALAQYESSAIIFYALEILLYATRVVTMNFDMVTTPALLSCLKQTTTTLTSFTLAVDSNVMVSVLLCIDGLKSLKNLNMHITASTKEDMSGTR
jgi:CRISPR/Cas system CMR subunit Cmr4 (Cas7 group RAMP superfamily)